MRAFQQSLLEIEKKHGIRLLDTRRAVNDSLIALYNPTNPTKFKNNNRTITHVIIPKGATDGDVKVWSGQ
jgi:hypothetical protein